jgi:hypothetical protein
VGLKLGAQGLEVHGVEERDEDDGVGVAHAHGSDLFVLCVWVCGWVCVCT